MQQHPQSEAKIFDIPVTKPNYMSLRGHVNFSHFKKNYFSVVIIQFIV